MFLLLIFHLFVNACLRLKMLNLFIIMLKEISKYETLMLQMIVLEKIYIQFVNKFILIYFNI